MKRILTAVLILATPFGCASQPRPIFTGSQAQSLDVLPTPHGFLISPAKAEEIVRTTKRLSLKHRYHIYADDRFYYVCDAFLGSSGSFAARQGVKVDGRTGEVIE